MKVGEKNVFFAGDMQQEGSSGNVRLAGTGRTQAGENQEKGKTDRKHVCAGELGGSSLLQDRIRQRREEARKQAMKVVGDAWDADRLLDQEVQGSRQHFAQLQQERGQARDRLQEIKKEQEGLQQAYHVEEGSREQEDLELLRKREALGPGGEEALTKEEVERLREIEDQGLTEYQTRQLELDRKAAYQEDYMRERESQMMAEEGTVRGIRRERLKHAPMLKATAQAEQIQEAAEEEVTGMVLEEARDHLEEEQEKREEEAQAVEEKKEEQEELLEERKERKEELQELTESVPVEEMIQLEQVKGTVQQEVQDILNKMNLMAEDIKGAMVDTGV